MSIQQKSPARPSRGEPDGQVAKPVRAQASQAKGEPPRRSLESLPVREHTAATSAAGLLDYIEIPFVHWRLITVCFLASLVACALALVLWPRSYESEAKLMIKVGRESVALDPTATTSQTLMLQKTQEEEVNSALEVLASRQVAELAVEHLGPEVILTGEFPAEEADSEPLSRIKQWKEYFAGLADQASDFADRGLLAAGIKDPISDHERAVRKVINSVQIYAPKRSTAVTIHAESKSPRVAQALAAAMADGFLDRHFSVSRTEGSYDFFLNQSQAVEAQLNELMQQRSRFMQESKIVSADDKRRILTEQLGAIEQSQFSIRGELEQALAEIDDLTAQAEKTPAEIVAATEEQTDLTWSGMRQRFYELEIQEKQLSSLYAADNPKLTSVREQLEGVRKILEEADKEGVSRQMTPNPVRIRIEGDLQQLQTRLVGLRSMLDEKEKQRLELNQEIDKLLDFELALTEMNRKVAVMENSLGLLESKLEEARVIDELQSDHISNVSIYQPATLVERAVSPSKPLLVIAFPLLGIICGFGLALVKEIGNKSLRTPAHVETKLGLPLLTSIPYSRQLKRLRKFVAAKNARFSHAPSMAILSEVMLATSGEATSRGRAIGVLGVDDRCGASTVASTLALAASQQSGLMTTLIDADIQAATVSRSFGLSGAPGLAELLSGVAEQAECVRSVQHPRLELVTAAASDWRGPLNSEAQAFANLLAEFQMDNDLVIVDLPPASRPDRASAIMPYLDYVVVVIESEKTDEVQARRLVHRLAAGNSIGLVLNKTRTYMPRLLSRLVS